MKETPFIIKRIIAAVTIKTVTTPSTLFITVVASELALTLLISFPNASKFKSDDPPDPVPFLAILYIGD